MKIACLVVQECNATPSSSISDQIDPMCLDNLSQTPWHPGKSVRRSSLWKTVCIFEQGNQIYVHFGHNRFLSVT